MYLFSCLIIQVILAKTIFRCLSLFAFFENETILLSYGLLFKLIRRCQNFNWRSTNEVASTYTIPQRQTIGQSLFIFISRLTVWLLGKILLRMIHTISEFKLGEVMRFGWKKHNNIWVTGEQRLYNVTISLNHGKSPEIRNLLNVLWGMQWILGGSCFRSFRLVVVQLTRERNEPLQNCFLQQWIWHSA